jgi:class 3 adenylate cyclase
MAACASCGAENRADAKFCGECGAALGTSCASCGAENEAGRKFCYECGAGLTAESRVPAATAPPAAERRLVSVLFADLVGFTAASEDRDPEETRELLSRYFETSRTIIERYGGVVEKFIGDAVMAVWVHRSRRRTTPSGPSARRSTSWARSKRSTRRSRPEPASSRARRR